MTGEVVDGSPLPPALAWAESKLPRKLVVFGSVCVLCRSGVRFVLARERAHDFSFAAAQSRLGQQILAALGQPLDGSNSVVVIDSGRSCLKSDAVIRVACSLRAPWRWGTGLRWLPRGRCDWACDRLAQHRYRLFGRYDSCMLPEAEYEKRFPQ